MLFESRYDAIFDVLPAGWPPYLFALRLRLAGNGRLFDNNLHSDEFDSLGDAIAHEFAARGPTEFLLLGLRLARSGRRASSGPRGGRRNDQHETTVRREDGDDGQSRRMERHALGCRLQTSISAEPLFARKAAEVGSGDGLLLIDREQKKGPSFGGLLRPEEDGRLVRTVARIPSSQGRSQQCEPGRMVSRTRARFVARDGLFRALGVRDTAVFGGDSTSGGDET